MADVASQIYFRFPIWPHLTFRKVRVISIPNFDQISQSRPRYYYVQFLKINGHQFWPFHCHRHVILQWPTKFYANPMIANGVMTSYQFYKMMAMSSQIYFQFLIWPHLKFRKVQSYRHTKFQPDISIRSRDITTSGFWKQTAAILKFYFRFWIWLFHCCPHVVFCCHTKFHLNRIIRGRVMTSLRFSIWLPSAMLDLV